MTDKPQVEVLMNRADSDSSLGETLIRITLRYPDGATIPWSTLRKLPQEEGSPGYPEEKHAKKK